MADRGDFDSEPEWVVAELTELLADLQEGLEAGHAQARTYFDRRAVRPSAPDGAWPFDVTLYNTLLRYHTKRSLVSRRHAVVDDPEYDVKDVANLGLHLHHGRFRLRVRKSDQLRPPVPGDSKALQAFYRQETLLPDDRNIVNVLALWRIGPAGVDLALSKPVSGDTTRESVDSEWDIRVPDLAHQRAVRLAAPPPPPAPAVAEDDLPTIQPLAEPDDDAARRDQDQG
jgi:hypothetical protein